MSLWSLFRHRLHAFFRSPVLGRRFVSLVVGAFVALYLGGALVLAGVFFDDIVRAAAPGADPLLVAARGLLPFGLGYAALQSVFASGLGLDPTPYRSLPVRRRTLVALLSVFALLNLWTAVPLAFVGAVGVEAAVDGAGMAALRFGLASVGVLAADAYLAPMVRRGVSARPLASVAGGLVLVAATGIETLDLGIAVPSLVDGSGWLFGGVVRGGVLPIVTALVLLAGVVAGYVRGLEQGMLVDRRDPEWTVGLSSDVLARLARRGPVWREAVLETRLLLRNAQTRWMLAMALLLPVAVAGFGVFPFELADLREVPPVQLLNTTLFPGLFASGAFAIYHGQNLFSYEGNDVEATMARPVSARHRVEGKLLFLQVGTVLCFLIPLPALLLSQSPFLIVHVSFFLYNLGVVAPAVVAGATFNRTALDVEETSFSQTNFSGLRTAVVLPLFALPFPFLFAFDRLWLQFGPIGALGLVSALAFPLWLRGLAALYASNRYAMMPGVSGGVMRTPHAPFGDGWAEEWMYGRVLPSEPVWRDLWACDCVDLVQNGFCTRPVVPLWLTSEPGSFGRHFATSPTVSRRSIRSPNRFSYFHPSIHPIPQEAEGRLTT